MRKLEAYGGDEITSTIAKAIAEANKHGEQVGFTLNGVNVVVGSLSDPQLIYREWVRGSNGCLGKNPTVGPYPKRELSEEENARDAAMKRMYMLCYAFEMAADFLDQEEWPGDDAAQQHAAYREAAKRIRRMAHRLRLRLNGG